MPWKETCVTDERMKFVLEHDRGEATMAELCEAYGISRKTGYKLMARYRALGPAGLMVQSRAPHRQGRQIPLTIEEQIIGFKCAHPRRGPRKIRAELVDLLPEVPWPSASMV